MNRYWEEPKDHVTSALALAGWKDLLIGAPLLSSRFDTRIDYVFSRGGEWNVRSYGTLPKEDCAALSDHLSVVVDLEL